MSHANRIPSLDGLRGVAAIAVMLFHFNVFFLPQARLSAILPLLNRGYLAVDLFFLLSGFVMTHVYGRALASNWRAHWAPFALARFARIYPVFAFTTLAMLALVAATETPLAGISFSGRSLALQPFLLQQWYSSLSWNYPSWSISTEAEAYAFFVFSAGLFVTGRYPLLITACCAAILATMCIANGGSLNFFEGFPALFRALSDFSLGALLYRAHAGDARLLRKWAAVLAVLFTGLGIATRMDFVIVAAFACLISYVVYATDVFGWLLNSRLSIALGDWSYSVYLLHAPAHYAVMAAFAASGYSIRSLDVSNARLLILATALGVVALSAVQYKYFERPARRLLLNPALAV